ncbi:ATP-binding protein [Actinomadura xylanilytica]|uniref:ATP-binding protein n=1 Tax=Actinomadura xylanilytica TaxID=887459 RepID=UPI00255A99E0|nr:LuxR C-terminal-related transcriptional regulator [Actinomadura xylanilytica]MDL4774617.1 LuxR C-terminal-related transcriptional regulator [Actinomadura xylanilytica]
MTVLAEKAGAGNLPAEVTKFIGRRRELAEAKQVLARTRLLTLTGVGGVGKTRLAVRLATDLRRSFADGVWLVELSALHEPELLPRTVADALQLPGQTAGAPLDRLSDHLADKRLLLLLDTCEHLVDGCALLSEVLLRAAPGLRILTTSREPLDVMGEHNLMIQPLPVSGGPGEDDAVALFADRAEAMAPGFALSGDNRDTVTRLCRRLDGIPLAIELAAVRLRTMSVEQLEARIDDRFRLLGTSRAGRDRHRTLRAAIEWSHELCTPDEQALWARLSVFPGDFDLTAAEGVCGGDEVAADGLFEVLGRLVEKSIVLCERDGRRYRMLDTIREYGAERLAELGEGPALRRLHRDHYLDLAVQARNAALGADQLGWLIRLRDENANLRVALEYSLSSPDEEATGLRLTIVLQHYWMCLGLFAEARRWHERALGIASASPRDRAVVGYGAAMVAVQQGEPDYARPLFAAALEAGDDELRAHALHGQALIALFEGHLDEARAHLEEARAAFDEIGYNDPLALLTGPHLSTVLLLQGLEDEALAVAQETVRGGEETGECWNHSFALYARGAAHWWLGEHDKAVQDLLACLRIKESLGDQLGITLALDLLTPASVVGGENERAAMLLGATDTMWRTLGASGQYGPHYMQRRATSERAVLRRLPRRPFEDAKRRGAGLSVAEAIALARGETASDAAPGAADAPAADPLTVRERQVAALVAEGLSNREIAERLIIAKRTVDSHVEHILAKLGFNSRTQIATWNERRDRAAGPRA